jgi:hypothetical protein
MVIHCNAETFLIFAPGVGWRDATPSEIARGPVAPNLYPPEQRND